MEQTEQIEEKLKLENDIASNKRELKNVLVQLEGAKKEYHSVASIKENNEKQILSQKEYLKTVLNDISTAKLAWVNEKTQELNDLAKKNAEADTILSRKKELSQQEDMLKEIEKQNAEIRNETRRNLLKIEAEKATMEVREARLKIEKSDIDKKEQKLLKDKTNFKNKVTDILKEVENL